MEKIELLAPAGSLESLYAAINKGADAVYLGGNKFSARAYASNFDNEELERAVNYCHLYGVKIYITLNTLIKENEFKEAEKYIDYLYRIGVDALIVQDLGVFKYIKDTYSDFEVHASTQMTVHNGEGAIYFKEKGFHRIVLSRELTMKEIGHISKELGIETEIFIHGALCISYSGQCLMSSVIGGRSGNRGRCAQSCRLPYNIVCEETGKSYSGYLLSPKDICTIEDVKDIVETGTSSLKIEGRMKRPEYVAGVIENYRKAVDSVLNNKSFNSKEGRSELLQLFNREGFSKAYLYKNEGKDMMAVNMPKNTGVYLGKIKNGEIVLEENISLKDGVRILDKGFTISKILKGKEEILDGEKGDTVKLLPRNYKEGDYLYKTSDVNLLGRFKLAYLNKFERKVNLKVEVDFKIDSPIELTSEYKSKVYKVQGDIIQKALKRPLDKVKLEENFKKSGETPFKINIIEFKSFEEGFMPVSAINDVRRKLIETIENDLIRESKKRLGKVNKDILENKKEELNFSKYIYEVTTKDQLRAVIDRDIKDFAINPFGKNKEDIKIEDTKNLEKFILKVPGIIKEEFNYVIKFINENKYKIKALITANIGILNKFKNEIPIIGDYKLNIFNSTSAKFYEEDLKIIPLSIELNRKEIKEIMNKFKAFSIMNVYGKVEVMVSEYCPIGGTFGNKSKNRSCSEACKTGSFILKDRMNEEFRVKTDRFCRSHIYNSVATNLIDEVKDLESLGVSYFKVDFIDESYNETLSVIDMINGKQDIINEKYTKGHYRRGVQ